jgi:hypothetical protein
MTNRVEQHAREFMSLARIIRRTGHMLRPWQAHEVGWYSNGGTEAWPT